MAFHWMRTTLPLSPRTRYKKPKDIKGERLHVQAKSVGEVKRSLRKVSGIRKIRSLSGGLVEVIHTNQRANKTPMFKALEESGLNVIWNSFWS